MIQIMENMGFVHEVKSLILQLGCIPNALLSEDYSAKLSNERLDGSSTSGVPSSVDSSVNTSNSAPSVVNGSNHQSYSSHAAKPNVQTLHPLSVEICNFQGRVVEARVIPSNFDSNLQKHSVPYNARSEFNNFAGSAPFGQSGQSDCRLKYMEQQNLSVVGSHDHANPCVNVPSSLNISQLKTDRSLNFGHNLSSSSTSLLSGIPVHGGMNSLLRANLITSSKTPKVSAANLSGAQVGNELQNKDSTFKFASTDQKINYDMLQAHSIPSFNPEEHVLNSGHIPGFVRDCFQKDGTIQSMMTANPKHEEACAQQPPSGGDDLFDILGVDFKNKLLKGHWNELFADESDGNAENKVKKETCQNREATASDCYYSVNESMLDSGIFSGMSTDHLLDAVVSTAKPPLKQNSDDISCRTTLTGNSTTSIPSRVCNQVMSSNFEGGLLGFSKNGGKMGAVETSSLRSGCSKDDGGKCYQTTTVCGSQLSSWLENGSNMKHENSVSTGYSKRPDEVCKSNRKRLKPGENPRPRPKDRQMIQDRVKELREIVPNGAKVISSLISYLIPDFFFKKIKILKY
jgi:hypothetical protein